MIIDWPKEKWEFLRDNIADVACWHMGFQAANPDHRPPPGLNELEGFGIEIRNAARNDK